MKFITRIFFFFFFFFLINFLILKYNGEMVPVLFLDSFIIISTIAILILILKLRILNAVFGFGILMVLITGEILRIYSEQIIFTGWLLKDVFNPTNRNDANIIISVSLAGFFLISFLTGQKDKPNFLSQKTTNDHKNNKSVDLVAVILFLLGVFNTIISAGDSLTETSYASGGSQEIGAEQSAVTYILGLAFLVASIFLSQYNNSKGTYKAKFFLVASIIIVLNYNLFRGDRDGTLTFFICLMGSYFMYSKTKMVNKIIKLIVGGGVLVFVLLLVGDIRRTIASKGWQQSIATSDFFNNQVSGKSTSPLDKLDLLPMMYWHTMDVGILVKQEKTYNWQSYLNLFPQSLPKPLADFLGFERPRNIAWELGTYFPHGGGLFIVAESYWNGGILSCILFSMALALILSKLELWFFRQPRYLMGFYFGFLATFPTCIYYSIQGMVRWLEVWFFLALLVKITINSIEKNINAKRI